VTFCFEQKKGLEKDGSPTVSKKVACGNFFSPWVKSRYSHQNKKALSLAIQKTLCLDEDGENQAGRFLYLELKSQREKSQVRCRGNQLTGV